MNRVPLAAYLRAGRSFLDEIAPACERAEICGSVRRAQAFPGDLEILAIPKLSPAAGRTSSLFAGPAREDLELDLWHRIEELRKADRVQPLKPGTKEITPDGKWQAKRTAETRYLKLLLVRPGIVVDLFLVTPETWGAQLAIRTGPAMFSHALVVRWTHLTGGGHFREGRLCQRDGTPIDTPEEADVFRACRLAWIEPEDRDRRDAIRPE